jgi:hypothetical protein
MAVDYPPLNKFYIASYAANDRSYPILAIRLDPRTAGYRVPEDLSPHPDSKRYPNHVFTGAQPTSGDQVVTHVYEILPDPYVPFTRYDDDLGPIQGRRRSVKNEGQVARLGPNQRVTYEAREGSAIVYTEIEEEWSIETDEDGNSLFPIKDRDFYDPSRGAVQERRQLFVPTGEEEGTLENINGVITQTSYEPYNEFLSVKVVQTYKVDGPQLVGRATDNEGQLVTITTQRKGSDGYIPPNPTATRTVEVNREDAESLVERIVDTPEIFTAQTFSVERPDPIPQKFRVAVPIQTSQEVVEGQAELPELLTGEISRNEEQRNKFLKRVSATSRDQAVLPQTLLQKSTDNDRQEVTVTETLQLGDTNETATATTTISSEALGDGNYVVTKTEIPEVFSSKVLSKERPDPVPQKFRVLVPSLTEQENIEGTITEPQLTTGEIAKSEQQVNKFVKRVSSTTRDETQLPQSLTQKSTTEQGLLATVSETLQSGDTSETPTALKSVDSEAMGDGTFVVRVTEIPKVFAGETFSVERPDPLPQKFRVAARTLTSQQTIEGVADPLVDLLSGQISKSEQQVTEFIKRTSVTSRDQTQLPVELIQKATDNEKQVVTVTQTLQSADTIEPPTATTTIESEALGDGNFLVTKTEVPEVFGAESYRKTKEDLTPQKFRAAQSDTVFEQTVSGTADPNISLEEGEFAKSEQQVNKFVKRVSTTSRVITEAKTLLEKVLTPQGQIGTRTLILDSGDQSFNQTLLEAGRIVDASVEALGDGRTVKTETVVPNVFRAQRFDRSRNDTTPPKFRALDSTFTIEETFVGKAQLPATPTGKILSRSEQQVTEFVKRVSRTERTGLPLVNGVESGQLQSKVYTSDLGGGVATVTEILGGNSTLDGAPTGNSTIDAGSIKTNDPALGLVFKTGLVSADAEALGDGRFIKRITVLDTIEELKGLDYDESLDVRVPYTQQIVNAKEPLPLEGAISIQPRDAANSLRREYDIEEFQKQIERYYRELPELANVTLPDRLTSAKVIFSLARGSSGGSGEGTTFYFNSRGSSSVVGEMVYDVEKGYSGLIQATKCVFFLEKDNASVNSVINKIRDEDQARSRQLTQYYPNARSKSHVITLVGGSVSQEAGRSVSLNSSSSSFGSTTNAAVGVTNTPPTVHPIIPIQIFNATTDTFLVTDGTVIDSSITPRIMVSGQNFRRNSAFTTEWEQGTNKTPAIPATDFPEFPDGRYLISISSAPYRFGYVRVEAVVADIFSPYVGNNASLSAPVYAPIIPIPPANASDQAQALAPTITISNITSTSFTATASVSIFDGAIAFFWDVLLNNNIIEGYQAVQTSVNTLNVTGLSPSLTYAVRVRYVNNFGSTSKFGAANVTTLEA